MKKAKPLTSGDVVKELWDVVHANGSQKETARVFCISPQYLNDILNGRREISAEVAEVLGYQRVVSYVPLHYCRPASRGPMSPRSSRGTPVSHASASESR